MKKEMSTLGWIAFVLVIVGALNWLLVGLFNWNLVQAIFGGIPIIEDIIYVLVGIGALYLIFAKK